MSIVFKTAVIALICAAAVMLIKSYIPQYAPFAQAAAMLAVLWVIKETAENLLDCFKGFVSEGNGYPDFSYLLIKVVGIAVIAKFVSELCRDSDNSSLAFVVELSAKIVIISMSIPMIENLMDIAQGFLKG